MVQNVLSTSLLEHLINVRLRKICISVTFENRVYNGLESASQVTTKLAPARILSDAYVVGVLDIGSDIVAFVPPLLLHGSTPLQCNLTILNR
jgi:hypothetical protein